MPHPACSGGLRFSEKYFGGFNSSAGLAYMSNLGWHAFVSVCRIESLLNWIYCSRNACLNIVLQYSLQETNSFLSPLHVKTFPSKFTTKQLSKKKSQKHMPLPCKIWANDTVNDWNSSTQCRFVSVQALSIQAVYHWYGPSTWAFAMKPPWIFPATNDVCRFLKLVNLSSNGPIRWVTQVSWLCGLCM